MTSRGQQFFALASLVMLSLPGIAAPTAKGDTATSSAAGSSSRSPSPATSLAAAAGRSAGRLLVARAVDSGLVRAASRFAQSWNTGHAGKPADRQYASWWANARGAGGVAA